MDPLVLGRIEIPRIGVAAMMREGDDDTTLAIAVGHITGTAGPGERGNMALAGHRDSFFRPLRDIRLQDRIRIVTLGRSYEYAVDSTEVVGPQDTWVLDPTDDTVLTLVTCYPFHYVGHAPNRFIVRASLVESSPAVAGGGGEAGAVAKLRPCELAQTSRTRLRRPTPRPLKRVAGASSRSARGAGQLVVAKQKESL